MSNKVRFPLEWFLSAHQQLLPRAVSSIEYTTDGGNVVRFTKLKSEKTPTNKNGIAVEIEVNPGD